MRRTAALLTALCSVALGLVALPANAAVLPSPGILLGVHTRGESLPLLAAMNAWEGKTNAFVDTEQAWHPENGDQDTDPGPLRQVQTTLGLSGPVDGQTTFKKIDQIWSAGSVPLLSWYPTVSNPSEDLSVARGGFDPYLISFSNTLRTWLAGPDKVYGTGDDRRLLLRFAPESNGNWHTYSPAWHPEGEDAPDAMTEKENALKFVAMWQHVHNVLTGTGLDPTHVAWVFAVAQEDSYFADAKGNKVAVMEQLFPGDAFTDWVGVDGYNRGGLHMNDNDHWTLAATIFDSMLTRLRAVSTRPTAVSEVGTTAVQDNGTPSDGAKTAWLDDYGHWVTKSGVGMAMYWDDDVSNTSIKPDYPVFGGTTGPDAYPPGVGTYRAYDKYAEVVGGSDFVGADASNPRIVTDAAFLGVAALPA